MPRRKTLSNDEFLEREKVLIERVRAGQILLPEGLREMRKAYGLTQDQLSLLSKVPRYLVSDIENGKSNPTVDTLNRLLRPFGCMVGVVVPASDKR